MRLSHFVSTCLLAISLCGASMSFAEAPGPAPLPAPETPPETVAALEQLAELQREVDRSLTEAVGRKLVAHVQRLVERENERLAQRYWGDAGRTALTVGRF